MPPFGFKHSKESRRKMSETHKHVKQANHFKKGGIPWTKGRRLSEEHRKKIAIANTGKHHSEESKRKIGLAGKGRVPANKGKKGMQHHSEKWKQEMSERSKGNRYAWRGGAKETNRRHTAKRRQLGFIPLNEPFDGAVAHHIDNERVIFIPEKLHKSIPHRQDRAETMNRINTKAFCWLLGMGE